MVNTLEDIKTLQNALISLNEGASDEKRMAIDSLENMLLRKLEELFSFERDCEKEMFI